MLEQVTAAGLLDRVFFWSFNRDFLHELRRLSTEARIMSRRQDYPSLAAAIAVFLLLAALGAVTEPAQHLHHHIAVEARGVHHEQHSGAGSLLFFVVRLSRQHPRRAAVGRHLHFPVKFGVRLFRGADPGAQGHSPRWAT